jgi:hypothetical protein
MGDAIKYIHVNNATICHGMPSQLFANMNKKVNGKIQIVEEGF